MQRESWRRRSRGDGYGAAFQVDRSFAELLPSFLSPLRGLFLLSLFTHGLRRGLHSFAALRLCFGEAIQACFGAGFSGLAQGRFAVPALGPKGYAVGRVKTKVLPRVSSLSARMEPPWARMMCLAMARPKPVPPDSRERALSTR